MTIQFACAFLIPLIHLGRRANQQSIQRDEPQSKCVGFGIIKSHARTALDEVGKPAGALEFFIHRLILLVACYST